MFDECVVLFSCSVGEGMEPVGVMTGAVIYCPTFHAFGNRIGETARNGLFVFYRVEQGVVGSLREIAEHCGAVEYLLSVVL